MDQNVLETIRQTVTDNPIVLYMKGTPQAPQCGFSSATVQIIEACVANNFFVVNVLVDKGVYEISSTIPTGRLFLSFTLRASLRVVPILCAICINMVNCRHCSTQRRFNNIETSYGRVNHCNGLFYFKAPK